ncbi:hypothetical protein [Falsarthrobacter nasiphocae]|uniref:Tat pathway signal sequence domain protein n=1 Tax=Falsarthrobacter nasiphocae TaxID=189863 RepID=A0AAE3YFK5_9MICC|nr:hypothetical protein [Falsarthrobacter nasiphocae]MDR6891797.1 hypothetical protein [Falsarthrobacter nasiphocae]
MTSQTPISRRSVALGASWALPAIAVASAAPASAASKPVPDSKPRPEVTCPALPCLVAAPGSAPSWTATRVPDGSLQLNWTLGTYRQRCVTYSPHTAYWLITPRAISITTEQGRTYTGRITTSSGDQPFAVSSTASPTLAANFRDYKFGYNSPFSNAVVGFVYRNKPVTFELTYVLSFRNLSGRNVATIPEGGCVYTAKVRAGQRGADVKYLVTSQGVPGSIV